MLASDQPTWCTCPICATGITYRASSQLVGLAVVRLVVGGLAIAHHGHNVREGYTGTVVLVSIEEDTKTFKLVCRSKDRAVCSALLGEPESETITVQRTTAVDLKFQFDLEERKKIRQSIVFPPARQARLPCCIGASHLPVGCCQGNAGEDPSLLRGAIGCEANVSFSTVSIGHCI